MMDKEVMLEKLNSGELLTNVEEVEQFLKDEGFILFTSVNTFFPQYIFSDTYNYTCLYQNHITLELKAMSKVTFKGYIKTIQEVSLEYVRNLHEQNPVKTALEMLELKKNCNQQITVSGKSEW